MLIPKQPDSPLQFVQATFGMIDMVEAAKVRTKAEKQISSYKLAWIVIDAKGNRRAHVGSQRMLPKGPAGSLINLPAQVLPFPPKVDQLRVISFYVAEVGFSDGTTWKADLRKLKSAR